MISKHDLLINYTSIYIQHRKQSVRQFNSRENDALTFFEAANDAPFWGTWIFLRLFYSVKGDANIKGTNMNKGSMSEGIGE